MVVQCRTIGHVCPISTAVRGYELSICYSIKPAFICITDYCALAVIERISREVDDPAVSVPEFTVPSPQEQGQGRQSATYSQRHCSFTFYCWCTADGSSYGTSSKLLVDYNATSWLYNPCNRWQSLGLTLILFNHSPNFHHENSVHLSWIWREWRKLQ
jgi:hypothetical protein